MVMLVEDNFSVRLDGTWLDEKAAIEAALKHIHDIKPDTGICLVSGPRSARSDYEAAMDMVIHAGLGVCQPD
ncbi:MAG: hypothetical protein ABSD74_00450 [Rhizomicrobium sp.]|jgi:hypothetical protein